MIRISPTEMNWNEVEICEANISSWLLASLIFDSIWPLKTFYTQMNQQIEKHLQKISYFYTLNYLKCIAYGDYTFNHALWNNFWHCFWKVSSGSENQRKAAQYSHLPFTPPSWNRSRGE